MIARLSQLILIVIPLIVLGWLINQEFVPTGVFEVQKNVNDQSPFIDRILPDARILPIEMDQGGDYVQPIVNEPAFFFVHPHRDFDQVVAEVWFKNDGANIIEFGGLARPDDEVYDLKPFYNQIIDQSEWFRIEEDGFTLLQREKTFETIDQFLNDPPPLGKIATYFASLEKPFRLSGYQPSRDDKFFTVTLRGSHEFKTYVKDEVLDFRLMLMDMNRDEGQDPVKITVFNENNEPVASKRLEDDGDVQAMAKPSERRYLDVLVSDLPEGVYKIDVQATRDIFVRQIRTKQNKLILMNNVYFGDEVGWQEPVRSVRFWTEAKHLVFQTHHAEGVQELKIGTQDLFINEPYSRFLIDVVDEDLVQVVAPRGDLILNANGHVALSKNSFFNPDPVRLTYNTDLDRLGIDYLISEYTSPEKNGDWIIGRAEFDTEKIALLEGTWKFAFSIPGIVEQDAQVDVGQINMSWFREPWEMGDLFEAIKNEILEF